MKVPEFLKNAFKDPRIGAVMPSSSYAVRSIMTHVPESMSRILEYGPGDGVLTKELLLRLPDKAKLVAFETNPTFAALLRSMDDHRFRLVEDSAIRACDAVNDDEKPCDLIISGIPFSMIDDADRTRIVDMSFDLLRAGGVFLVYQTSPLMVPYLKKRFDVRVHVELRNVPPYVIMVAKKSV